MKAFFRKISPVGAAKDLAHELARPQPYRWHVLGVSLALTFAVFMIFIPESQRKDPERPVVTYITSFAPNRSDDEIIASNEANQIKQDERRAAIARAEERRKELYRALGQATGIDTDAMEREIAEDEAAEASGAAPSQERLQASNIADD